MAERRALRLLTRARHHLALHDRPQQGRRRRPLAVPARRGATARRLVVRRVPGLRRHRRGRRERGASRRRPRRAADAAARGALAHLFRGVDERRDRRAPRRTARNGQGTPSPRPGTTTRARTQVRAGDGGPAMNDADRDLLAGEALGVLSREEERHVAELVTKDRGTAKELERHRATVTALEAEIARKRPSADLFDRILAEGQPAPAQPAAARRQKPRPDGAGAGAGRRGSRPRASPPQRSCSASPSHRRRQRPGRPGPSVGDGAVRRRQRGGVRVRA